jgi:V/A-type H+-transporting ATPase subunit C
MRRPARLDYAYSVGRVRALESQLVSKTVFMEAAEEEEFISTLKVIFEAGQFKEENLEIQNSEQLDEFLEKERQILDRLASEILLEEEIREIAAEERALEDRLALSESLDYPFIKDYLRHRIDLGNLKVFCRIKYLGLPQNRLEMILMQGGFLEASFFLDSFELSFGEVGDRLKASNYQAVWVQATDELLDRETFVILEREQENFLMHYLRKAKYIVFGPEPVFAYILAKKRELQLIRFLGVGKLNQVPAEIIKERISETYV